MTSQSHRLVGSRRTDFGGSVRIVAIAGFALAFIAVVAFEAKIDKVSGLKAIGGSYSDEFLNSMPLP